MFTNFLIISLISIICSVLALEHINLEDVYHDKQCVRKDIPIPHSPFFSRNNEDVILSSNDMALTFNLVVSEKLMFHFDFSKAKGCQAKTDERLQLILITKDKSEISLIDFLYSYDGENEHSITLKDNKNIVVEETISCFGRHGEKRLVCDDRSNEELSLALEKPLTMYQREGTLQMVLKYVPSSCPISVIFEKAKLMDRFDSMQRKVTTTPNPTTTSATKPVTKAIIKTESTVATTQAETTTIATPKAAAASTNKAVIIAFSVIGVLLLLMACGVAVYFIYTRFLKKKKKEPAVYIPSSRSMPLSTMPSVTVKTQPSTTKTQEVVMDPDKEDKTQSLSLRPVFAASPAKRTETQYSVAPAEPTQSSVAPDPSPKSVVPELKTARPKTEDASKTIDLPPLVIEKSDNYTKIKKSDFERGHEDSMASEEGCGDNIHNLEPLVTVALPLTDPSLESYPADYVEKMALRKATIADRAVLHLQAVMMASNYLLKKGFKNDGKTLTGSDQLMDWLKTKSPFLQFVAECVEVRPDVTALEFNASKIQWRRYLKKIDFVETYRQSCWLGQTKERREFFLLATFFKLEQLAQQYSIEDLKLYPFPVPYFLEVRNEAPHFFKVDDTAAPAK